MTEDPTDNEGVSRRRVLLGATVAAGVWAAPAIVSVEAASAATAPPGRGGAIAGVVTLCGNRIDPGFPDPYQVDAVRQGGGGSGSVPSDPTTGAYLIPNLPAGTYDVTLTPLARQCPPDVFNDVVVTDGATTPLDLDYTGCGC